MTVDQLPGRVREFVNHLNELLTRLDQRGGWCAVFWQRDPDGMRACLDGREVPPWDVVEALLQDFATVYGQRAAAEELERARPLHAAATAAYDDRPGGRDALGDRLDVMLREQRYAAERQVELGRLLAAATTRQEADALRLDLAWAHDDHARATARCAELQARMAELDAHHHVNARTRSHPPTGTAEPEREPWPTAPVQPAPTPRPDAPAEQSPAPRQRKRRRGSARFAGLAEEESAPVLVPPSAGAALPAPGADGRTPRGARFAGAAAGAPERSERPEPRREAVDAEGAREVAGAVERLVRLRAEGRSGEAHVLLAEAAQWPPARFPLLAHALQGAGLGADWATLLWETVSLPAGRLVAVADALVAAGRGPDGEQIMRQGVARPPAEMGQAVLALAAEGRHREVRALLDVYVRARTPEEAARSAEPDPQALVPLLLEAARGASEERHWDLVHALRVAGFAP